MGLQNCPGDAGLREGLSSVMKAKKSAATGGPGGPGGMFGPDLMGKLAGDPRTAGLLGDAGFMAKLNMLQQNPNLVGSMINDPQIQLVLSVAMGVNVMSPDQAMNE